MWKWELKGLFLWGIKSDGVLDLWFWFVIYVSPWRKIVLAELRILLQPWPPKHKQKIFYYQKLTIPGSAGLCISEAVLPRSQNGRCLLSGLGLAVTSLPLSAQPDRRAQNIPISNRFPAALFYVGVWGEWLTLTEVSGSVQARQIPFWCLHR